MELTQLLTDYLSKTLGRPNDSITALLYKKADDGTPTDEISETALSDLEAAHAEHIKAAPSDDLKAEFDKGHKQGSFEALSKAEDAIRKKYQVEGKKLEDIISAAISNAAKVEGSDDKILIHPLYLGLKNELETKADALKSEYESNIAEIQAKADRQAAFSSTVPKIEQAMSEAGVVLPKNPAAAATIKKAFLDQFNALTFEHADGKTFLKGEDGKLLKDQHGHPVTVEAFTKAKAADWFDIEKQPGVQSPGNDPAPAPTAAKWNKDNLPKSFSEYETLYYSLKDAGEKTELTKAFQEAQAG